MLLMTRSTLQGDLKHTKNRELRLERLQGSLKMLMNEKEAKLNNTSLNSRAVVEKTGALQARIEELEAQLAEQKVCINALHVSANCSLQIVILGSQEASHLTLQI